MPRLPIRPTLALLGALALLGLAACAPTATGSVSATRTATLPSVPTATPTPALAPTPTNVPAGWKVLQTTHFSLAYPPDLTAQSSDGESYTVETSAQQPRVIVTAQPKGTVTPYCRLASPDAQQTTLAGLPMKYILDGRGPTADPVRLWLFANAQQTYYLLEADDFKADAATKAQDEAIFATFHPDNADPWKC